MTFLSSSSAVSHPWIWNIYFCGQHAILPILLILLSFLYTYTILFSSSSETVTLNQAPPTIPPHTLQQTFFHTLHENSFFIWIESMTIGVTGLLIFDKIIWQGIPVSIGIILSGIYTFFFQYRSTTSFIAEKHLSSFSSLSSSSMDSFLPTTHTINISTDKATIYSLFGGETTEELLFRYIHTLYRTMEIFLTESLIFSPVQQQSPETTVRSPTDYPLPSLLYLLVPLVTGSLLTILCLIIFPPMHLPPLNGKYQTVGTVSDVWERPLQSIFFHKTNGTVQLSNTRKVPIQIYYPSNRSKPNFTDRALLWTTGGANAEDQLRGIIYQFTHCLMGLPTWCSSIPLSHFLHTRARYCYNVPLNNEQEKWPVIIYSHGLFGWKAYNSYICSELASQGYIVVGVDHIGDSICSYECSGLPTNDPSAIRANTLNNTLSFFTAKPNSSSSSSIIPSLFTLFTDGKKFISQSLDDQRKIFTLNAHVRHTDILHVARRLVALSNEDLVRMDDEDSESIKSTSSNDSSSLFSNPRSHISSSNISPSPSMENMMDHDRLDVPEYNPVSTENVTEESNPVPLTATVANVRLINLFQGHLSTLNGFGILGHSYGGATSILAISTHGKYAPIPTNRNSAWSLTKEETEEDDYMHSVHVLREPYYSEGNLSVSLSSASSVPVDRRSYCWYAPSNLREPKFAVGVTLDAFLWGICDGPTLGPNGNPFTGIQSYRDHQACKEAIQRIGSSSSLNSTEFTQRIQTVASKYKGSPLLLLNSDKGVWEYELLQIPFMNAIIDRMNMQEKYYNGRTLPTKNLPNPDKATVDSSSSSLSSVAVTIPGCGHLNFTDLSLVCHPYFLRKRGRIGPVHPIAVLVDIAQRTGNYFQHHLPVHSN